MFASKTPVVTVTLPTTPTEFKMTDFKIEVFSYTCATIDNTFRDANTVNLVESRLVNITIPFRMALSYCTSQTYGLATGGALSLNLNKGQGFVSIFTRDKILQMFTLSDAVKCQVETITLYDVDGSTVITTTHALYNILALSSAELKIDTNFDTNNGYISLKTYSFKIKIRSHLDKKTAIK